jgi:Protein of unknown function (DUF2917)
MEPAQQSFSGNRSLIFARWHAPRSAKIAMQFAVEPGAPLLCLVRMESEIRSNNARVWLTRERDERDYWLLPGESVQVRRGERIWLSAEGSVAAELTLTHDYRQPRFRLARWWAWGRSLLMG